MRLIEKKNDTVGVTVDNGALMNYAAVGAQNGALCGFSVTLDSGNVKATKGRLIVQGYTFEVTESTETLFDLIGYAVADTDKRTLYLKVSFDATTRNSSYAWYVDKTANYHANANIQNGETGDYYYPVANYVKNGSTITNFESLVKSVYIGTGQASAGTGNATSGMSIIAEPTLSLVTPSPIGTQEPYRPPITYVTLGNANEYEKIANSYTLRLEFYRKLHNAKYRSSQSPKLWTRKTQWVKSEAIGSIAWSSLIATHDIQGGTVYYKRIIMPISQVINKFFRTDAGAAVVLGTTKGRVHATRAKIRKVNHSKTQGYYKHNFLEFAFKVKVYNLNGSLIGESGLSNSIFIAPQEKNPVSTKVAVFKIKTN